jgi:hypothetical protein
MSRGVAAIAGGDWFRFSRYEVRDGYIRPAAGARLERYDPWSTYWPARSVGAWRKASPPYQALLDVLHEIRLESGLRIVHGKEQLLTWCTQHGLLGVLLHQVSMVALQARDGEQRRLLRTARGWMSWKVIPPRLRPGVLLHDLRRGIPDYEPLTTTWARFFPDVSRDELAAYLFPLPGTEAFWRLYSEPLGDFLDAARLLYNALDALRSSKNRRRGRVGEGLAQLQALAAPVRQVLIPAPGGYARRFVAPALFSSFAAMAVNDLVEEHRFFECANRTCRRLFVTAAYQAKYCRSSCQETAKKRRQRARRRKLVRGRRGRRAAAGPQSRFR